LRGAVALRETGVVYWHPLAIFEFRISNGKEEWRVTRLPGFA
jgi:hypothetical protein